jgi:hypothetical protein
MLGIRKAAAVVLATVSVQASASEIDNLINSSQNIRATFKNGIQAVGGLYTSAQTGGIAKTGVTDPGLITKAQQDAYNNAVLQFQNASYTWNPNAEQYFQDQSQQAMVDVSAAVDAFVEASYAVIQVATVNEMAQVAANAPDSRQAIALQEYTEVNDVLLDDTEVSTYNDSLQAVEVAAQTAAAYMAVAQDATLLQSANDSAFAMNVTYQESSSSFFDAASGTLTVYWNDQQSMAVIQLQDYYVLNTDVLQRGQDSMFFRTSPEGGCWFIEDQVERENCMYGS